MPEQPELTTLHPTAHQHPAPRHTARRLPRARSIALVGVLAAGALLMAPGAALAGGPGHGGGPGHSGKPRADATRQALDALVRDDGFPAALAAVTDAKGRERDLTAGVADLDTGARVPVDGQVRIGSSSKTYTAVVVLQLVAEGAIDLDETVEAYLPGLVRGDGIDGHDISVRQLLNHTSGLPEYTNDLGDFVERATWYRSPRDLLDVALALPRSSAPGEGWSYSNTNYVLAGLIVEKVTHRPLEEAITQRIIEPLGLTDTYVPGRGETTIRGEHPRGYHSTVFPGGGDLVDLTELDPSFGWAAGEIVATPSDVNRFFLALLDGKLLAPAQLEQMRQTVAPDEGDFIPGAEYGLGLVKFTLTCGTAWGHGGDIPGYETRSAVTEDGRAATIAVTALPAALHADGESIAAAGGHVLEAMDTALCR